MTFGKGWVASGILAVGLIVPVFCKAAVTGTCSSCHTMHNSVQGNAVAFTRDSSGQQVISEAPFEKLLKTDCLGCHTQPGSETIIDMGEAIVPVVLNITEPTYPPDGTATATLAGGNFHWVINRGDPYGHNVNGIAGVDLRFPPTQAPGGVARAEECANCHGTLASAESGCQGCHVPMHHAASSDVVAGKEQGWYRFLGSVMQYLEVEGPTAEGVVGIEAADWEQNPLPTLHNTYQGKAVTPPPLPPLPPEPAYTGYLESGAISQKCIGCHGQFHNETISDSVWIRHPVEVVIPDSGEFTDFTTYNPLVPVARQNVTSEDAGFSEIIRDSDVVSCISCHRAHGSPYPAMLRWGYRDWPGTDAHTGQPAVNGCAVCHTSKD